MILQKRSEDNGSQMTGQAPIPGLGRDTMAFDPVPGGQALSKENA